MFGMGRRKASVDELDSLIVRELQVNARLSNRELAARIGLAPSSCLVRTRALVERGVLTGFHADVDLTKVGLGLQAMVAFQVRPLSRTVLEGFQAFALRRPEVIAVYVLTGNDDFLVHIATADLTTMHAVLMDHYSTRKEVVSFRTSVIYSYERRPTLTLPAGSADPSG
jgi:DNA-binding Lrp family transcriptional regulator